MTQHRKKMIYALSFAVLSLIAGIVTLIAKKCLGLLSSLLLLSCFCFFLGLNGCLPKIRQHRKRPNAWETMSEICRLYTVPAISPLSRCFLFLQQEAFSSPASAKSPLSVLPLVRYGYFL